MGLLDRLSRLLRANLNAFVSDAEDPIKILDQSVADMQEDLVKLRQAVAIALSSQKRLENQRNPLKKLKKMIAFYPLLSQKNLLKQIIKNSKMMLLQ